MRLRQDAVYEGSDWWQWSVYLDAPKAQLDKVRFVEYTLHESFPQPVQRVRDRGNNFQLKTYGWGEFRLYARVVFEDGSEKELEHDLELRYPSGERTSR